jgi:hypothetical protein
MSLIRISHEESGFFEVPINIISKSLNQILKSLLCLAIHQIPNLPFNISNLLEFLESLGTRSPA